MLWQFSADLGAKLTKAPFCEILGERRAGVPRRTGDPSCPRQAADDAPSDRTLQAEALLDGLPPGDRQGAVDLRKVDGLLFLPASGRVATGMGPEDRSHVVVIQAIQLAFVRAEKHKVVGDRR